ncbi:MAG: LOG family protein [Melioribacteraceae bacterium]
MKRKTVTIFGSSLPKPGEQEYEDAYQFGKLLAQNNLNVCTGGFQGIMDGVSKGASEIGTESIGITVDLFNALPSKNLSKEIKCATLFERIEKLIEYGDAFIILPGGTGTLVELSLVWEFINKGLMNKKPIACFGSMWKSITEEMEKRIFAENRATGLVSYFDDIEKCTKFIVRKI